jgi:hypothetical protein
MPTYFLWQSRHLIVIIFVCIPILLHKFFSILLLIVNVTFAFVFLIVS